MYVDAGFVVVTAERARIDGIRQGVAARRRVDRPRGSVDVSRTAWAKDGRAPHLGVIGGAAALAGGFDAGVADHALKDHPSVANIKTPLLSSRA